MAAQQAFVSLITNDRYAKGALVLGQSLKASGTSRKLALLVAYKIGQVWKDALEKVYDELIEVNPLDSSDSAHLALMKRPELGVTFTKLHCWTLTQYSKCVFMDADTLVVENIDSLFEREELSAAPDIGWPDMFNTGVFVFKPSIETYNALLKMAVDEGSFDGGDQGLLNQYFNDWSIADSSRRLPFVYNMAANLNYSYLPALLKFGTQVKVVHFLGQSKPWDFTYNAEGDSISGGDVNADQYYASLPFIKSWWKVYHYKVSPLFDSKTAEQPQAAPFSGGHSGPSNGAASGYSQPGPAQQQPRGVKPASADQWERGHVDYTGDDRFANIQAHLDSLIAKHGY